QRIFFFLVTLIVVGVVATIVSFYARGWRFDSENNEFSPNGLLVIKSAPDGAQIFINGKLETATDATISLQPRTYDIQIQKEGYLAWNKRLVIEKEIVTEATAHLFKSVPSLSAVTFSSSTNPTPSHDMTKIAYVVLPDQNGNGLETQGLWVMEMLNLPLGFARDPKRITDGNMTGASLEWSPNGQEIMLTTNTGSFLLDTSKFTAQAQRTNITTGKEKVLAEWKIELDKKLKAQIAKLPDELESLIERKVSAIVFSPDEDMIVYTASGSAKIPDDLVKQLPGASTQKEERDIKDNHTYVYDIKEDRNFLIDENATDLIIEGGYQTSATRRLSWFITSRHLVLAEKDKVTILDYDTTNRQTVYAGSYLTPHAFPTLSLDRLIILTSLGATSTPANLYSLSIK
ncbi:PEGA domain-containing protein, partial [Patescibacteria group bacterium]|nr:PEGA domain-containing protein [Patescibacteria group bacterium]